MRAFDRDLIRGGHYGQRLVCRANRPNTWLHRPACKREENPCQLGAVHTWHKADMPIAPFDVRFRVKSRRWIKDGVMPLQTRLYQQPGRLASMHGITAATGTIEAIFPSM